jgi:hypothetical protein
MSAFVVAVLTGALSGVVLFGLVLIARELLRKHPPARRADRPTCPVCRQTDCELAAWIEDGRRQR